MTELRRIAFCGALLLVALTATAQDAITQTRDGYLWLGGPAGLQRYDSWEFVRFPQLAGAGVTALAEDAAGSLWIGSSAGLFRFRSGTFKRVGNDPVFAIAEDRMHTMWVASRRGVARLAETDAHPLATDEGAPGNVTAIRVLGDDVWFGTLQGLVRYSDGTFTTMSRTSCSALAAAPDGKLWIGREHGGVDVFANGTFTKPAAAAPLALTTVVAVAADRDGKIWISAEGKGICRMSGERLDCNPLDDVVRAIYQDREGNIWLGTASSGLHRLSEGTFTMPIADNTPRVLFRDRSGGTWTGSPAGLTHNGVTYTVRDGLATTWVHALVEDRDGAIWIGTSGGLSRRANGKITTIASDGDADVRALHVDGNGRLWIGTMTGLRCIEDGRLTRCGEGRMRASPIYAFDEAPDGTVQIAPNLDSPVYGIVRDDGGNPWYLAAKGIYRGRSPIVSIPSDGHVQPAAWRSDDGQLWFVTMRGILSIDPKRAGANKLPPPVVIERTNVSGRDAEFRFAALSFVDPEKVRYRTMLEGFDRGWSDPTPNRIVVYADLPPGRYVFRVIAANNDGVWNTAGASVPLRIEAAFWQRWWFRIAVLAAIAALVTIAVRIRRANAELEVQATIDPLTKLANRRSLDAALGRMWSEHARRGDSIAVILCDIDHFKKFNDTYGHQAGDRALVAVAQALRAAIDPTTDVAARFGGEEFMIVLPHTTLVAAAYVAQKILQGVRALRIAHGESIATISAGVAATVPDDAHTPHDLIRESDEALYLAKANGRNRFEMANLVRASSAR